MGRKSDAHNPQNTSQVDTLVPQIRDKEGGWDLFSRLLKDRIIRLDGPVTDEMSAVVTAALHLLEAENADADIWLFINSPGGSVTAGLAIIDAMRNCKPKIVTVTYGDATSMASVILCAGDERYATPNARILIHQPLIGSGEGRQQQTEVSILAKDMEETRERLTAIYARRTGLPFEVIDELIERDNALTAEQAKKLGLVDEVMTQELYFERKYGEKVPDYKKDPYPDVVRKQPRKTMADKFNDVIERAAKKRPRVPANDVAQPGSKGAVSGASPS